ncbi:MAG: hypothetical protein OEV14_08235, partial [Gammaproteobacteria bacterium]|nr:hypothetical protein [Gammaproteobacteria bacterium]
MRCDDARRGVAAAAAPRRSGEDAVADARMKATMVPPYPTAVAAEAAFSQHVGPAMARLMKAL